MYNYLKIALPAVALSLSIGTVYAEPDKSFESVNTIEEADYIANELASATASWTGWATGNNNQDSFHTLYCAGGSFVNTLEAKEQGGYGLIDMRIRCGSNAFSAWATGNGSASILRSVYTDGSGAYGLEAREQGGYGLVDGRLFYPRGVSAWLTDNTNGTEKGVFCPSGQDMAGMQVKEQGGYGLIDVRLYCVSF